MPPDQVQEAQALKIHSSAWGLSNAIPTPTLARLLVGPWTDLLEEDPL